MPHAHTWLLSSFSRGKRCCNQDATRMLWGFTQSEVRLTQIHTLSGCKGTPKVMGRLAEPIAPHEFIFL